ncbi:MAG: hypothetical protein ABI725_00785 [Chloroflexota bacterium]
MKRCATRPVVGSILTALLLSLMLVSQVMAAGWSAPIALTNSGKADSGGGLVTLGTSIAVAAYENNGRIIVRRSTNSAQTWSSPLRLSDGQDAAAAGRGTMVDVVWALNDRIRYARSGNSAESFAAAVALSPTGLTVADPSVGRGPNGLVVVAWLQDKACCDAPWTAVARVSKDGGSTFGPVKVLGRGYQVVAAAGKGVAYVAIDALVDEETLVLRRTTDGGMTWNENSFVWPGMGMRPRDLSLTAGGKFAYVSYDTIDGFIGYRRTASKGSSWSAALNLTPAGWQYNSAAAISFKAGVVRAAFVRFGEGIWFTQSNDGLAWSAPQQAVAEEPGWQLILGVGHATRAVVLYTDYPGDNVSVVSGTP